MAVRNRIARILVASDDPAEADSVSERLLGDFERVGTMVCEDPDTVAFTAFAPDVLVLAIKGVNRAERFLLGLLRLGDGAPVEPFRTILLCGKEEVALAFELCKKGYFDDYALHWPMPYDGARLRMSVWVACRESAAPQRLDAPAVGDLVAHVESLDEVDAALEAKFTPEHRALLEPHLSRTRELARKVRQMRLLVLMVEDDPLTCALVERVMESEPVDLIFASDGPSALSALRRQRPDLILMDVRLPGADGISLTRRIKASPLWASIPLIVLTGTAKRETVEASMAAGAAGFLVKPVTREMLLTRLRQHLPKPALGAPEQ